MVHADTMMKSDQTLEGDNSNQAGRDIHVINNDYAPDIERAEKILEEIFQKKLPYFTEIAEQTARERVKPVAEEMVRKILQQKPEAINAFAEPAVQYMLGSTMKTASSTDDSVIRDTLIQLAVDHVLSEERSYDRIVDEQPIDVPQKMNRDILKSLQELAFWNTKCAFVTKDNIINFLTKGIYTFDYGTHLESIGCAKLNSKNTVDKKLMRHLQMLVCDIYRYSLSKFIKFMECIFLLILVKLKHCHPDYSKRKSAKKPSPG